MARPEVTGRRVIADQLIAAFSIREFCAAHRISQSMYFKMRAMGLGPREMAVGSRRLISQEAAAEWRKAREAAFIEILIHDLRAFTTDRHKTVDDRPFGGGEGMVLKPEPLFKCVESLGVGPRARRLSRTVGESVILLSPQGRLFTQEVAKDLAALERIAALVRQPGDHLADRGQALGLERTRLRLLEECNVMTDLEDRRSVLVVGQVTRVPDHGAL